MITQQQAEIIVKRYSPTTNVVVQKRDGQEGIYLTSENTISITSDWSIAGLLHEITHAILFLEDGRTGHDGVFADRFTKIVNDYMENLQCKEIEKIIEFQFKQVIDNQERVIDEQKEDIKRLQSELDKQIKEV